MNSLTTLVLPFFALIGVGFFAVRRGILSPEQSNGLAKFVFLFPLPALLYNKTASTPFERFTDARFILAYLTASIAGFVLAFIIARSLLKLRGSEASLLGLGAVYGNMGFLGIPLLILALGDAAAAPLSIIISVDIAIMIPAALILADLLAGQSGNIKRDLLAALTNGIVKNPIVLAIIAGVTVSALELQTPLPLLRFSELLSGAAAPGALVALGGTLAQQSLSTGVRDGIVIAVFKTLAYPALVWTIMGAFHITPELRTTATLAAAMPTAAVLFVLVQKHTNMTGRASAVVLISTVIALVSLSVLLSVLT